jgi:hypothetical protein
MSTVDLIVIASNLIVAFGVAAFCIRRDRSIAKSVSLAVETVTAAVESISRASAWQQPLNSYPMQSPAQN